jgi:hypothetical protein
MFYTPSEIQFKYHLAKKLVNLELIEKEMNIVAHNFTKEVQKINLEIYQETNAAFVTNTKLNSDIRATFFHQIFIELESKLFRKLFNEI